jgi:hypothetical protein
MKFLGIIQGRLTKPDEGFQICPTNWQKEFVDLQTLRLTHIEWIITPDRHLDNPFFIEDISNFPVSSVCLDNLVDTRIIEEKFLESNLIPACERIKQLNWKSITIPLLENSSIEENATYDRFLNVFSNIVSVYKDIKFCLETELSLKKLTKLCNISDNVKVTYDTGNTTSYGVSHEDYIDELFSRIEHVHLKDRTFDAKTKEPGQGDTPFARIFSKLKNKNYENFYTLQTARCTSGEEFNTIERHSKFLRKIYDDS